MGYEDLRQKVPSLKAPLMIGLSFLFHQYIEHRRNVMRADKFVPQYMRVSHQASYSIFFICTCNHEVVVFYDTPHMLLFNIVPRTFSPVNCMSFVTILVL